MATKKRLKNFSLPRQEGAVLILALILLVVLTMLGISAIESTKLETRMAANTAEYNRAFQIAEYGITNRLRYYSDNLLIFYQEFEGGKEVTWPQDGNDPLSGEEGKVKVTLKKSEKEGGISEDSTIPMYVIVNATSWSRNFVDGVGGQKEENEDAVKVKLAGGLFVNRPRSPRTLVTR